MRWIRRRKHREEELDREIRAHLELEAGELQESAGTEGARLAAQKALGSTALVKEAVRETWGWVSVERLLQDFRYSLRTMARSPGFTAVAVLSLALSIGANTAIFTFVNAALLKPLPYPEADRIVVLLQQRPKDDFPAAVHPRSFVPWHDRARSFEALAIAQSIPLNTVGPDGAEQLSALWATSELFRVFGVKPLMGRLFHAQEGFNREALRGGLSSASPSVVLSHGFWMSRFGGDPNVLGRTFPLERGSAVIAGVLPAGFRIGSQDVDLYLPLPLDRARPDAIGSRAFYCYGLLRPGVTLEAARAEMAVLAAQVGREEPTEREWGVIVSPLRDHLVRDHRRTLLVLMGVVAFVLLIACANLAGLLLTRGAGRRSELALRSSLGAARGRLVQQLLIESLTLSAAGSVLGLGLGLAASRALAVLAGDAAAFGQFAGAGLDWRVLAFTAALAASTAIGFGLAPAWQASRFDLQAALRSGRSGDSRGQHRLRGALVIGEIALAVVLLAGAGLLLRTLDNLLRVKLGFQPENVMTMRMMVTGEAPRRSRLVEDVLARVRELPAVRSAGTIQFLPLTGFNNNFVFRFTGTETDGAEKMESDGSTVSAGYFASMGIPVLRGRDFGAQDTLDSPRAVLVNEAFVRKYSPGRDPIGRQVLGDWSNPKPAEIVGVVGDIRHTSLNTAPRPTIFLGQVQLPGYITYLVVRTSAEPRTIAAAIRREVREVDPRQPVTGARWMTGYVSAALAKPRLYGTLVSVFAALALLLATIGLYGLMAYTVSRRTHEIGIRLALGAEPRTVLRSTVGQALGLIVPGLALGAACAVALSRFATGLLYGVRENDPLTYAGAAALLGGVAVAAAYLPARRASKVDPVTALRYE